MRKSLLAISRPLVTDWVSIVPHQSLITYLCVEWFLVIDYELNLRYLPGEPKFRLQNLVERPVVTTGICTIDFVFKSQMNKRVVVYGRTIGAHH